MEHVFIILLLECSAIIFCVNAQDFVDLPQINICLRNWQEANHRFVVFAEQISLHLRSLGLGQIAVMLPVVLQNKLLTQSGYVLTREKVWQN